MNEIQYKNPVPKTLAKINPLIHLAIYFTQSKCAECDQTIGKINLKKTGELSI